MTLPSRADSAPSDAARDTLWAWALLVLGCAILPFFTVPDAWWMDAGELTASIFSAGVSHPTGFPLVHALGKLATLAPAGGVAFRVNLFSTLCGAATLSVLFLAIRAATRPRRDGGEAEERGSRLTAAAAAAGLLGAYTFWMHTLSVEVYVPTALCLALWLTALLALLARPVDAPLPLRPLAMMAFCFGVGAGAHVTFPFVGGVAALPLLMRYALHRRSRRQLLRALPLLLALVAFGALVIAYLPLVASRGPWRNWGDPSTGERLWQHLSGARIRLMFTSEMGGWNWAAIASWAQDYGRLVIENVGLLLAPAAIGVAWLARRRPAALWATALALLADAVFSIKLNPMGIRELQTSIPSYLVLTLWAGVGAAAVARALAARRPANARLLWPSTALLVLLLPAPQWTGDAPRALGRAHEAASLARGAMDLAPPGALWVTSSDSLCALTAYLQGVENHRPDLGGLVKQQLWDPVYVPRLADPARGPVISAGAAEEQARAVAEGRNLTVAAQRDLLVRIAREHLKSGRPVLVEPGDAQFDAPFRDNLEPIFPLWRLHPRPHSLPPSGLGATPRPEVAGRIAAWSAAAPLAAEGESRRALAHWHRIAASTYTRRGELVGAVEHARAAAALAPELPGVQNNLAVIEARRGALPRAIAALERAVAEDPGYRRGWMNLGGFRAAEGSAAAAYAAFARAAALDPTDRDRYRAAKELGRIHGIAGQVGMARFWLERALAARPGDPEVSRMLEALR